MSDNWFVQHPEVMRYILKHEQLSRDTDAWIKAVSQANAAQAVNDERCVPVVWMEDEIIHTIFHPFCGDDLCPCHADFATHDREIMQPWVNGLLTEEESDRIFYGKQV